MASLALMVSLIFISVLLSGPVSLFFLYFNFYVLSAIFAVVAIILGIFWCLSTPFPISIVGMISLALGITTLTRM